MLKALDKARDKRFQDADAFSAALDQCLPELATARASQTGVFGRARTSKAPWVLAAVVLLTSIAIAAGILISAARDSEMPLEATEVTVMELPAEPSQPTLLRTTLDSEPSGASVWQGEENLGVTPYIVEMGTGQRLDVELRLEGHVDASVEMEAGLRRTVEMVLEPEPVVAQVNMRRRTSMAPRMSEEPEEVTAAEPSTMSASPYTRFGP